MEATEHRDMGAGLHRCCRCVCPLQFSGSYMITESIAMLLLPSDVEKESEFDPRKPASIPSTCR